MYMYKIICSIEILEKFTTIYSKQELDETKRQILVMQEKLFEDGDLHSEGQRQKKFRWRNANNEVWIDHTHDSDNSDDDAPQFEDAGVKIKYKSNTSTTDIVPPVLFDEDELSIQPEVSNFANRRAFSGPANSILSYVLKDKRTVEALSKKAVSPKNLLKRPLKKLKPIGQRKTKAKLAPVNRTENTKPSGPNMLELLSRFE